MNRNRGNPTFTRNRKQMGEASRVRERFVAPFELNINRLGFTHPRSSLTNKVNEKQDNNRIEIFYLFAFFGKCQLHVPNHGQHSISELDDLRTEQRKIEGKGASFHRSCWQTHRFERLQIQYKQLRNRYGRWPFESFGKNNECLLLFRIHLEPV